MNPIRTLLCVPGHQPHKLEKALTLRADCLMFDLEDSVPAAKKDFGLETFIAWFRRRADQISTDVHVAVRVNAVDDVSALTREGLIDRVQLIVVPKIGCADDVSRVAGDLPALPVIETPMAILNLESIFALPSLVGGIFGVADYAACLGRSDRGDPNRRFLYAKQKLATVAAATGKQALDTSFYVKGAAAEEHTRAQWNEVAEWGFTGGAAIHPSQLSIASDVFRPGADTKRWSEEIIDGDQREHGEVWADRHGCVVGTPTVKQARSIERQFTTHALR